MYGGLGLSALQRQAYLRALVTPHDVNFRVQIMDLDHHLIDDISHAALDGQVTVDWEGQDATRALSMILFDPDYSLGFDTAQVIDGAWFYDRMIQVRAEVWVDELNMTVSCPVFTGPVRKVTRVGATVTVGCVGKDQFARQSWPRFEIPKGTNTIEAIRLILAELGETFFRIEATTTAKLASKKIIDRNLDMSPWGYARLLASTVDCRLFYAGDGYAVIRDKGDTKPPVFTFVDGYGGAILTRPEPGGDYTRLANVVRAEGMAGSGRNPFYEAMVDPSSDIHPQKLLRGGKPFYQGVVVQQESIKTDAQAKSVAKSELADRQFAVYDVAYDAFPIYPLEEGDVVGTLSSGIAMTAPLLKFAFGFQPKAVMPVGYKKHIAPAVARIRKVA